MAYIGKQPVVGNFVKLDAITTSATATYNLLNGGVAYFPQTANNCIVSLNGVIQSPTSAYTISGSTIVFDSALTSDDSIDFILVLGDVLNIGTPSDATVGFAKVTSNLITGATAETSIAGGDSVLIYDDSASALRKMTRTNFVAGVGGANTPAFLAYLSTTTSVTNATATKITFDTEDYDVGSVYDNSTGTFTVGSGQAGKYLISSALWCNQTGGEGELYIGGVRLYKNGSLYSYAQSDFNTSADDSASNYNAGFVVPIDLAETDYLEIYAIVGAHSGTTQVLTGTKSSWFSAFKLIE
jgi:hypothetical protein